MKDICSKGPVMPVIEIEDAGDAIALAEALLRGGISVIEITLRTNDALKAIEQIAGMNALTIGAGTLLHPDQVQAVQDAGATFGVSPGATADIVNACEKKKFPFLPGASTVSEVMRLREMGFLMQKFFPAEAAGGIPMLKSIAAPIQDVNFCPTGGVSRTNTADYLSLPNVICVGGSWVAPKALIAAKDWKQIEENARIAQAF